MQACALAWCHAVQADRQTGRRGEAGVIFSRRRAEVWEGAAHKGGTKHVDARQGGKGSIYTRVIMRAGGRGQVARGGARVHSAAGGHLPTPPQWLHRVAAVRGLPNRQHDAGMGPA